MVSLRTSSTSELASTYQQLFLLGAAAVCFQRQLQILNAMAVFYLVERIPRYRDASIQYSFQVV